MGQDEHYMQYRKYERTHLTHFTENLNAINIYVVTNAIHGRLYLSYYGN